MNTEGKERAALRERVKMLRRKGMTYKAIAIRLNASGVRTIRGKRWTTINAYIFSTGRSLKAYKPAKKNYHAK